MAAWGMDALLATYLLETSCDRHATAYRIILIMI